MMKYNYWSGIEYPPKRKSKERIKGGEIKNGNNKNKNFNRFNIIYKIIYY